jgi:RNA polymerase sigma factor (sigma-70 family)
VERGLDQRPEMSASLVLTAADRSELSGGAAGGVVCEITAITREMARGDEDAFRHFHVLYFHRLLRYLIVVARGDEHAARDALQETLTRVARHVKAFESEVAFWAWLTRIARSSAIDAGRRESRFRAFLHRFREQSVAPEFSPARDSDGERSLLERMLRCLTRLDPVDRELLEGKYLQRSTVRNLAERLETTEKAVESRLTRARERLRALILQSIRDEHNT